jgi:hypothetical protein
MGDWDRFYSYESEALSTAEKARYQEQAIICWLGLSDAHVQIIRWYEKGQKGDRPPLLRDDASAKATHYARDAKQLAESQGMKDYAEKADRLLALIAGSVASASHPAHRNV